MNVSEYGDGCEVIELVPRIVEPRDCGQQGGGREQDSVAVGRRLLGSLCAQHGAGAWLVLDDDRLIENLSKLDCERT
jgi:hypothetical protein